MESEHSRGRVRAEPSHKRVRAYLGKELAADTTHPLLVWEVPYYPAYYIPSSDIRAELVPTGEIEHSPSLGVADVYDVRTARATAPGGARRYPASPIEEIRDTVRLVWNAMDEWLEEDELVYVHPATRTPGWTSWPAPGTSGSSWTVKPSLTRISPESCSRPGSHRAITFPCLTCGWTS